MGIFWAVVPNARWTYYESANLRGRPAQHIVAGGESVTLCGRNCEGWQVNMSKTVEQMGLHGMCRVCRRKWERIQGAHTAALGDGGEAGE
jgi:hypothetical protein